MLQTVFDHLAWIEHKFLRGIRDSRKAGWVWGVMRGVGGVRKSIPQSWLAKGLGLLCWGFKGVQEEIPREEAITLQIGSVAFPPGQCTSPQLHPCHRVFDQDRHQDSKKAVLLQIKSSSKEDPWFRHGFGAEASLPRTPGAPAVSHNTTRLYWMVFDLDEIHIRSDIITVLFWIFFYIFPLLCWWKSVFG